MGLFLEFVITSSTRIDSTPEKIWDFFMTWRIITRNGIMIIIFGIGREENRLKLAQKLILKKLSGGHKGGIKATGTESVETKKLW